MKSGIFGSITHIEERLVAGDLADLLERVRVVIDDVVVQPHHEAGVELLHQVQVVANALKQKFKTQNSSIQ